MVVKKASEAIGVEAGMITVCDGDNRIVRQVFGLQALHRGMLLNDEDTPYLKLVEQAKEPVVIHDVDIDGRVSHNFAKAYGMRSVLAVPLVAGGDFAGVLSLICTSKPRHFTAEDIDFAHKLGTAVSLALNNIRIYEAQIKAKNDAEEAKQELMNQHDMLQLALLPTDMHVTQGYTLATCFAPGAAGKYIGGDFYDVFETEEGKTALLIGDVTGKGVEAASLAVAMRSTIRSFAYDFGLPDKALTHSNAVTYSQSLYSERFATVFLVVINPQTGQFLYASAGHPQSMVLRVDGTVDLLKSGQLPIGIENHIDYISSESQLYPGDKLIMYTDGISESHKGTSMYGEDGIKSTLEKSGNIRPEKLVDLLFETARDIIHDKLSDDAAVIVIERDSK